MKTNCLTLILGALLIVGCEEQGPLERAGEEADEAIENVRSGGESLQDRLDDAADRVRDEAENIADELNN